MGVAVSGGADSVALLFLLSDLRSKLGFTLRVLHLNHQLRGPSADADQAFVEELARRLDLPCTVESHPVRDIAQKERSNLEEAARKLRQQFFQCCVEQDLVDCVATAHTADDQAETVIMHLLRGTGIAGLAGIHPVAGIVVRPLLDVRRSELREYLQERQETWREDASNQDTSRMRARIRSQLLPLLIRDFAPSIVERLSSLGEMAREESKLWDAMIQSVLQSKVERTAKGCRIHICAIQFPFRATRTEKGVTDTVPRSEGFADTPAPRALQMKIVRGLIAMARGHLRGISAQHVDQVMELMQSDQGGIETHLPGLKVSRNLSNQLDFRRRRDETPEAVSSYLYEVVLPAKGEKRVEIPERETVISFKIFDCAGQGRDTNDGGAALDCSLLHGPLVLRNWRPGDSYRPLGRTKAHKLKRLFSEKRIPVEERGVWPVLVSGEAIAWTREFGPAADFALNERSRTGVRIQEETI